MPEIKEYRIKKGNQYLCGFGMNDESHPLWFADKEFAKLFDEEEAVRIAKKLEGEVV